MEEIVYKYKKEYETSTKQFEEELLLTEHFKKEENIFTDKILQTSDFSTKTDGQVLKTLIKIQSLLKLKDHTDTSFICALTRLESSEFKNKKELKRLAKLENNLDKSLAEMQDNLNLLKRTVSDCKGTKFEQESRMEEFEKNIEVLEQKKIEYREKLEFFENMLEDGELNKNRIANLQELELQLNNLNSLVNIREEKLKSFFDLKPDFNLSKIKFEEKVREFNSLVEKKDILIQNLSYR
ncbi:hypothetical protein HK099_006104 [Clydaea vesicula]|uniref:Uncharacterized protein n=1 Tax=Clydaea vesicula TaxID=447962 RepID=A0AAD5U2W6_9FUNG|nr:hypothetical protein HK099_006104 [Clydaea vesicula]KAJ3390679.1 hypothetical protein HDU92_000347 [Lobulomyces angularis]